MGHVAAVLKQSGRNLPKGYSKEQQVALMETAQKLLDIFASPSLPAAQRTLEYTKRGVARERSVESPVQRSAVQSSRVQRTVVLTHAFRPCDRNAGGQLCPSARA